MEADFKTEYSMQRKIILQQNDRLNRHKESTGNRVAKLIDKVEQLKRINNNNNNNNNNNDVRRYFDFDKSLDDKQKELLNRLLKSLMNDSVKFHKELKEKDLLLKRNSELETKC